MLKQLNWANRLTILRLLFIPLFVICLIQEREGAALIIFLLAGITDGLDGLIARSFSQKTTLGTFLDPMADKLLLTAAFLTLAIIGKLPGWLAVVTISRDIIIVAGSSVVYMINNHLEISPTIPGKLTTCFQLATIVVRLLQDFLLIPEAVSQGLIWLTAAITVFSGLHYIYIGANLVNNSAKTNN